MSSCCKRKAVPITYNNNVAPITPQLIQNSTGDTCNICQSPLYLKKRSGSTCIMYCNKCNMPYPKNC